MPITDSSVHYVRDKAQGVLHIGSLYKIVTASHLHHLPPGSLPPQLEHCFLPKGVKNVRCSSTRVEVYMEEDCLLP